MSKRPTGPVALLKQRLQEAERAAAEQRDSHLRAVADFENYRRRMEQTLAETRRTAAEDVMCELFPVLDNFARALAAADGDASADSLRRGLEMIQRQLGEVLVRRGVESFSCIGEEFDPRRAEAVSFVHSDDHPPDAVVAEECGGYAREGRVLRPARVVVSKPSPEPHSDPGGDDADVTPSRDDT